MNQKLPPTYLANFVFSEVELYSDFIPEIEWRGQLKSSVNNKLFKIKYYGEPFNSTYEGIKLSSYDLIGDTDFAPILIYAVDIETDEEILLFDGCKHGYDALFCNSFTQDQIIKRPLRNVYQDLNENDIFEIIIKVYHNIDYEDEFSEEIKHKGGIETTSGQLLGIQTLKRDGFDYFELNLKNKNGETITPVSYELA